MTDQTQEDKALHPVTFGLATIDYTLILIIPVLWIVYPIVGFLIWGVVIGIVFLFRTLHVPAMWAVILGFIPFIMSFFWGMVLEKIASQNVIYRWIRTILRVFLFFVFILLLSGKDAPNADPETLKFATPEAIILAFFMTVLFHLLFQKLDRIYFPVTAEMKRLTDLIQKGERPQRKLLKRLFYGFIWFVPMMMICKFAVWIMVNQLLKDADVKVFYEHYGRLTDLFNFGIWYLLCLLGRLPGTGKYLFSQKSEEFVRRIGKSSDTNQTT
ncbi:MAG: hypothetical protein KBD53_08760 [Candidatus Omnitrophica bacterium]|nr:hypothetical protein [Candidatus Omnitrophota bacterium]